MLPTNVISSQILNKKDLLLNFCKLNIFGEIRIRYDYTFIKFYFKVFYPSSYHLVRKMYNTVSIYDVLQPPAREYCSDGTSCIRSIQMIVQIRDKFI